MFYNMSMNMQKKIVFKTKMNQILLILYFGSAAINHNTHKFVGTRGSKHVKMYICRKWCRRLIHCTFFLFEVTFTATREITGVVGCSDGSGYSGTRIRVFELSFWE